MTLSPGMFVYIALNLFVANSLAQSHTMLKYTLLEELQAGAFVGNVLKDSKLDTKYDSITLRGLSFRILKRTERHRDSFRIEQTTGNLSTTKRINRDIICPMLDKCLIPLDIAVTVGRPVQSMEIIKAQVEIVDINDNWPQFPRQRIEFKIPESTDQGASFVITPANDPDSPTFGINGYQLVSSSGKFELKVSKAEEGTDLHLILSDKLDREAVDYYQVKVIASDKGTPPKSGTVTVDIFVLDSNDNNPTFVNNTYDVSISENTPVRTTILKVYAADSDAGKNGDVVYSFSPDTERAFGKTFGINKKSGEIFVKGVLDYEKESTYHLDIMARDKGPDSLPARDKVTVRVLDYNDHAPSITVNVDIATGGVNIPENAKIDAFVAHVSVEDQDTGINGQFNCTLNDYRFSLNQFYATEFQIRTARIFDREIRSQYNITFSCKDNGTPPLHAIRYIPVTITDENDHTPKFAKDTYDVNMDENNRPGAYVVRVNATDRDAGRNAAIVYRMHNDAGGLFRVDPNTGIITAINALDYEKFQSLKFHVIASDQGSPPKSTLATIVLSLTDINDEKPKFSQHHYVFGIFENQPVNAEVGSVVASDADGTPYNDILYSLDWNNAGYNAFAINRHTGKITTRKMLDRELQSSYTLTVVAENKGAHWMSGRANITIYVADKNDNDPYFEFPTPYNNTVYLSNLAPPGHVITKVVAFDLDTGANARLSYSIQQNIKPLFIMDENTGVLLVNQNLAGLEHQLFEVICVVKDHGFPAKTAMASLNVVVNKSIALPHVRDPMILSGHNFTIVVSLAGASGFLVIIFVVVIIIIKRQNKTTSNHHKYVSQNIFSVAAEEAEPVSEKTVTQRNNTTDEGSHDPRDDLSFDARADGESITDRHNLSLDGSSGGGTQVSESTRVSGHQLPNGIPPGRRRDRHSSDLSLSTLDRRSPCQLPANCDRTSTNDAHLQRHRMVYNPTFSIGKGPGVTERDVEAQSLLHLLNPDRDSDSACSADVSTSDSGRGASEEGDTPSRPNIHTYTRIPHYNTEFGGPCRQIELPSVQEVSPEDSSGDGASPPKVTPRMHGQNGRMYPVANCQPIRRPDGGQRDSFSRDNNDSPTRNVSNHNGVHPYFAARKRAPSPSIYNEQSLGKDRQPCRPIKIVDSARHQCEQQRGYPPYEHDNRTTNRQSLSADDVSEDGTTTSGSYVVDASDLYNERLNDFSHADVMV